MGDHVIALALGIEEAEVPMLLHIADSKLTNLMALDPISSLSDGPRRSTTKQTIQPLTENEEQPS
jgi:hypothetical protein